MGDDDIHDHRRQPALDVHVDELSDDEIEEVLNYVVDGHHDLLVALLNRDDDEVVNTLSVGLSKSWRLLQEADPITAETVAHYLDEVARQMDVPAMAARFDVKAFGLLGIDLTTDEVSS